MLTSAALLNADFSLMLSAAETWIELCKFIGRFVKTYRSTFYGTENDEKTEKKCFTLSLKIITFGYR